jgi:colanic acid biosynthesis protein WcaH
LSEPPVTPGAIVLAPPDLLRVVALTPLVSVDLVVVRGGTSILLGLRNNRPAHGTWFVPGGRIGKDETVAAALARVAEREIGMGRAFREGFPRPHFLGAFEHFYPDNFSGQPGLTTHYVVLAHRLDVPEHAPAVAADDQHAALRWWPLEEALADPAVHENTRVYCRLLARAEAA